MKRQLITGMVMGMALFRCPKSGDDLKAKRNGGYDMAFAYDHDCPFEVFITNLGKYNEGNLVGEWVKFPTTEEELKKVFERIGIEPGAPDEYGGHYEEWFIMQILLERYAYSEISGTSILI